MLRAQLEERKKAILQRINQEGKEKLEKVLYYFALLLNLLSPCSFGCFLLCFSS